MVRLVFRPHAQFWRTICLSSTATPFLREFGDVVFEDVGFENSSLLLTALKLKVWGIRTSSWFGRRVVKLVVWIPHPETPHPWTFVLLHPQEGYVLNVYIYIYIYIYICMYIYIYTIIHIHGGASRAWRGRGRQCWGTRLLLLWLQ